MTVTVQGELTSGLKDRSEFTLFKAIINLEKKQIKTIGGMSANENQIRKIFKIKKKK